MKILELIQGKFTGFSNDFNGIFIGNLIVPDISWQFHEP